MVHNVTELGPKEAEFLVRMSADANGIFTSEDAQAFWGTSQYAKQVLHRLINKRWIARLKRGTYMVIPMEAGPERMWSEEGLILAPYLAKRAAVAYWSALHFWHMTEQLPRVVFLQTPQRMAVRSREILGIAFRLVTVKQRKYFGIAARSIDGRTVSITDREKTLIDAADRPELSGGIAQLATTLKTSCEEIDWTRVGAYLERFGSGAVVKRLGYLVEVMSLPIPNLDKHLERWHDHLSRGISLLEPSAGTTGKISTRWRLRINVSIP